MSPNIAVEKIKMIVRSQLMESINSINFSFAVENKNDGFSMDYSQDIRFMPYNNTFWGAITYEMSLTRHKYTKIYYTYVDLVASIGGLIAIVSKIGHCIIVAVHFDDQYNFVMGDNIKNSNR